MALTQIDDRGLKTPIDLLDNEKIRLGTGNDLELYHDGSHSRIVEGGTGNLMLQSDRLVIANANNSENMLVCDDDTTVELYFNGVKKLETTSTGVSVTGNLDADQIELADAQEIRLGAGQDLKLVHDGSNSYINNSTGALYLRTGTGFNVQNAAGSETYLYATENGAVFLKYDNSTKLETTSTGITVTGDLLTTGNIDLGDTTGGGNNRVILGAGDDLQIYHDGSNSYIADEGTGNLNIITSAFAVKNAAADENMIATAQDGNVELFYNGSKKFETTSDGVMFTGVLKNENDGSSHRITLGAANDFSFYHDGTNNIIDCNVGALDVICENNTNGIRVHTDGTVNIGQGLDNRQLRFGASDDLKIYHDGTRSYINNSTGNLMIEGGSNGIDLIKGTYASGEWMLRAIPDGAIELYHDGSKKFETTSVGAHVDGLLVVHKNSSDSNYMSNNQHLLQFDGDDHALVIFESSANSTPYGPVIHFTDAAPDDNTRYFLYGVDSAASRFKIYSDGDVWTTDSGTLSSDVTLKENIVDATPKLEDIKKLKVRNFNWKSSFHPEKSKKKQLGFIAQEVEEVFPALVTEHDIAPGDGIDNDHTPVMKKAIKQAWNPIIIKAMQELIEKVETLETKVAALEAA